MEKYIVKLNYDERFFSESLIKTGKAHSRSKPRIIVGDKEAHLIAVCFSQAQE